jgi:hypothetical protein
LWQIVDLAAVTTLNRAKNVWRTYGNRSRCLEGTRTTLLNEIDEWISGDSTLPIFWLNGLAGTGKTTIAQTVADKCFRDKMLGAAFFFPDKTGSQDHDDHGVFFPALAFQLACHYPAFLSKLVLHPKRIFGTVLKSLEDQVEDLIVAPLRLAEIAQSIVIVIDALDNCGREEPSSSILEALKTIVKQVPLVKFFITSRPDPVIRSGFDDLADITQASSLHDIGSHVIENDIRTFLNHELSRLTTEKGYGDWLTAERLDLLCGRAAGLFMYATAIVKFFIYSTQTLDAAYAEIEDSQLQGNTRCEGMVKEVHRGLSLDSLCVSILRESFRLDSDKGTAGLRLLLATLRQQTPLPSLSDLPREIETETGKRMDLLEVKSIVKKIYPLMELPRDENHPVRLFHKLLFDCLADNTRCSDERFRL